ncbi:pilus assembly protein [Zooshikella sp. RANM57]|uniref:pilus assembly protein n=1 Tax=Zooshikella sp. RANM57 TaxID=3425863 RepID=UPI003D6ED9EA
MNVNKLWCIVTLTLFSSSVLADDTDIYVSSTSGDKTVNANVLLIIDTSGSMKAGVQVDSNYKSGFTVHGTNPHTPGKRCRKWDCSGSPKYYSNNALTRFEIVQDAAAEIIWTNNDVNMGIMRFDAPNAYQGGYILAEVQDISTNTKKNKLINIINAQGANGGTPLSEVLHEAFQYMTGRRVVYGKNTKPAHSVSSSYSGNNYISPMKDACQSNTIVYFTDGQPTVDGSSDGTIKSLISSKVLPTGTTTNAPLALSKNCKHVEGKNNCLDELGWYMGNFDMAGGLEGEQKIKTHTIGGFGLASNSFEVKLLKSTAARSGGKFYLADNYKDVIGALKEAIAEVRAEGSSFVSPSVSVSAFNSLEHSDELYFVLFKPEKGPRWTGNLKRYKLKGTEIVDATENNAVQDGFFKDTARSFWTTSADGGDVGAGGMVSKLPSINSRILFTYTGLEKPNNVSLNVPDHKLLTTNSAITKDMLGSPSMSDARRENILRWALGYDEEDLNENSNTTEQYKRIGDPIHSSPTIITYFADNSATPSIVDQTVYFGTNEGFFHAINTINGQEEFAFVPQELLGNFKVYKDNVAVDDNPTKVYGLDGPISIWMNDINGDRDVLQSNNGAADTGEFVYAYVSMRRGGRNIYALDITNRASPKLKWIIKGGVDNSTSTETVAKGNFSKLGQTWSKAMLAKVKFNGVEKKVLIFTGGYDPDQDNHELITTDDIGNAIYMVDADTGNLLWFSSNTGSDLNLATMDYSFPAPASLIDINGDGIIDYFFVADVGGHIWRFDINAENTGKADFAKGGMIAQISGSGKTDARRFYNAPDISMIRARGEETYLAISIGSGYRANPLNNDITDRFFMIRDPHVFKAPDHYSYITDKDTSTGADTRRIIYNSDLYDATNNLIQDGSDEEQEEAKNALASKQGWFIDMEARGEKVLAKSKTIANKIVFTSYQPNVTPATNPCSPSSGQNRRYLLNLENAAAVATTTDPLNKDNRYITLSQTGILGEPETINGGGSSGSSSSVKGQVVCNGLYCEEIEGGSPLQKTYWRENL